MGRNYSFLLYGTRAGLADLLKALAALADPPVPQQVLLDFGNGQTLKLAADAEADKTPRRLDLSLPKADYQLVTWLEVEMGQPDPAEELIHEHWAEANQELLPQRKFRFAVGLEITVSERFYELSLCSPTSSGSAIFSFSPNLRHSIQKLLRDSGAWFGLFDSEQDIFKVLPRQLQMSEADWGRLHLSFEEEDLILYSDQGDNLDTCVEMLQNKIKALPESENFLGPDANLN
ncbi:MAG: hypothetical protein ACAI44_23510 [Candidatus Sericytochromatia bacterium]